MNASFSLRRGGRAAAALSLLGVTALGVCAGPVFAGGPKVAILGSPDDSTWNTDVQSKLVGTGLFSSVDVYNISNSFPDLATLQQYGSVLVYTDGVFDSTQAGPLGDELDTYLRGGGGVVDAVFANANTSFDIGGAFAANNDYSIEPLSQTGGTDLTLVKTVPGSPLLNGVNSFDGGSSSYHSTGALNPTSTEVAAWSDTTPLVAYHQVGSGTEVGLNFFPPSSDARGDFWLANTDGALLMGNALDYAANPSNPVPEASTTVSLGLLLALGTGGLVVAAKRKKISA